MTSEFRIVARRLARVEPAVIDVAVWRHVSMDGPGSGEGARALGGRFNPPDSFPVLYGALGRQTAAAELLRMARSIPMPIQKLLPRHVYWSRLRSDKVLDLREAVVREALGLPAAGIDEVPMAHTQLIGELAPRLGYEVIAAPSETGLGDIVAVFTELIPPAVLGARQVEIWVTLADIPVAQDAVMIQFPVAADHRSPSGHLRAVNG